MQALLKQLKHAYPSLQFTKGAQFCWSPQTAEVVYATGRGDAAIWSLLHETGHALLEHNSYQSDFELLKLEVAAWDKAHQLADTFGITIDEDHIQDCLDTYRDWLHKRCICPTCQTRCLQQDDVKHYHCFNCGTVWRVSTNRFCRAYRSTKRGLPRNSDEFVII